MIMKLLIALSVIVFLSTGCRQGISGREYPKISRAEELVNETLAKSSKAIAKKYNLITVGLGAGMPSGNIKSLKLNFEQRRILSRDELRKILVQSAQDFLSQINARSEMTPFLNSQPFGIKNVEIVIFQHDKCGYDVYDPAISIAEISKGVLIYETFDPEDTFKVKSCYEESYEEALKIIQETEKSSENF